MHYAGSFIGGVSNIVSSYNLVTFLQRSCVIEFDGASKGNPGPAGAAAVLRTDDGSLVCSHTPLVNQFISLTYLSV